jgi:hypothetical protein
VPTALILGDTVDIDFEALADLYVLQMTYQDGSLPAGMAETDLRLLFYDALANGGVGAWVHAIAANSDGGAGGLFFDGSYQSYLDTLALPAMPQLSMFGVDSFANHVWAVLDHHSTFGVGIVPEPAVVSVLMLAAPAMLRRRRRAGT